MITIKLSFFAILQSRFGEGQSIEIDEPMRLIQLFDLFKSNNGEKGSFYFLENGKLKAGYSILIDGRNIHALEGLYTIIGKNCEVSFFPLIAGGFSHQMLKYYHPERLT